MASKNSSRKTDCCPYSRHQKGASFIECGLLITLISLMSVVSLKALGKVTPMTVCTVVHGAENSAGWYYDPVTNSCAKDVVCEAEDGSLCEGEEFF